ncbi:MAG: hypothetical protein J6X02_05590 [Bacilli bacterium]|nr:hypothetical protein [Bacilli bacterium]
MTELTSIIVRGEYYEPDKYTNQAKEYNKCVDDVNTSLDNAIVELDNVNKLLGLDSESAKDVLTKNVLVGNEEIKDEIKYLVDDLDNYTTVISKVATDLDIELEAEAIAIRNAMDSAVAVEETEEVIEEVKPEPVVQRVSIPSDVRSTPNIRDNKMFVALK